MGFPGGLLLLKIFQRPLAGKKGNEASVLIECPVCAGREVEGLSLWIIFRRGKPAYQFPGRGFNSAVGSVFCFEAISEHVELERADCAQ